MKNPIAIPHRVIEGYLEEVKRDEMKWTMIMHNIGFSLLGLEEPIQVLSFSQAASLNRNLVRKAALEAVRRLLADNAVVAVREGSKRLEVLDIDPEQVVTLLEKNPNAYDHYPDGRSPYDLFLMDRNKIGHLKKISKKPIKIICDSASIVP